MGYEPVIVANFPQRHQNDHSGSRSTRERRSRPLFAQRFVSREKLCLSGTTEFWVNDSQGLPLMVVTRELNENRGKDGRMLLKEIFSTHADLYPDYANKTLTVTLHTLSSPRANQAAAKLCEFLNQTETEYPYTDLKLIYKTMAV